MAARKFSPDRGPEDLETIITALREEAQKFRSLIPASRRYGAVFRKTLRFLLESQGYSEERIRDFQLAELRRLLIHAGANVPYYRESFRAAGFDPRGVKDLSDIEALPLLSREMLATQPEKFVAENLGPRYRLRRSTGGTSGNPLGFFVQRGRTDALERAFIARSWGWLGVRFEDRAVLLRGHTLPARVLREGNYWCTNYPERNWTLLSSFHLSDAVMDLYVQKIRELRPVFLNACGADLDILARHWIRRGFPPIEGLRMVHLSGEELWPEQRDRFRQAFGGQVFSNYGQTECSVLASECERNTAYHVFPEYGVTEIVRPDGSATAPGELGELVGTGFSNYVMPMIRYRTGDLAVWREETCDCGRPFRLLDRLEGRAQHYIVGDDGRILPLNSVVFSTHMAEYRYIKEMQVRQDTRGRMTLALVPYPEYTHEIGRAIAQRLERVMDGCVKIDVELSEELPRSLRGKRMFLVQKLPIPSRSAAPAPEAAPRPAPAARPVQRGGMREAVQAARSVMPPGLRYGGLFRTQLGALQKSQFLPLDSLRDMQRRRLRRLLQHVYDHVPYYQSMMRRMGIQPQDVRDLADLSALPLLSKEMIAGMTEDLLADNFPPARRQERFTGGTTGTPLGFFVERGRTDALERAFIARSWGWMGVNFADRCVILKGQVVDERELREGRFWQTSYPERSWTFFSAQHMSEENLPAYARKIMELRPVFIQSFPSGLDLLAKFWLRRGLPPIAGLRMVHLSSETLRVDQRERFQKAFGAPVFSNYGQSECAVLASECEHDSSYHVFPEYGVTEIVRPDGTPTVPGELGEIVGTGFNNYAMPMIRYRTGDLGSWSRRHCVCGRPFPLMERLEGRGQDVVVARDGHIVPLNALIFGSHLPEFRFLKEIQVRQKEPGELTLAVVPYPEYTAEIGLVMAAKLERVSDQAVSIRVEVVDQIPRTAGGKFQLLIQSLPATWWGGYGPDAGAAGGQPGGPQSP